MPRDAVSRRDREASDAPHDPLGALGWLLGWCALARAQGIPVYDNTNFLQNLVTAAQSTLTAIATAETAANTILDLTPLDEIITASGIIEDLAALAEIMAQVDVLSTDIASLQAQVAVLFGLDTAPASTSELQVRLREIRRLRSEAYIYAMRLQTLMRTAIRTIEHLGAPGYVHFELHWQQARHANACPDDRDHQ